MRRKIFLIITVLIFTLATSITGCNSSKEDSKQGVKKLLDCLALTKTVNSVEVDLDALSKYEEESFHIKMNMKLEDIKNDMKVKMTMDVSGQMQELYMNFIKDEVKVYVKDASGKYQMGVVDASQVGNTDVMKSFDSYSEIINNNPDMIKKKGENVYQLNVTKEKSAEFYSILTGQTLPEGFEDFVIEFVIGSDNYLQKVSLTSSFQSASVEVITSYMNYNKNFNIEFPSVSN